MEYSADNKIINNLSSNQDNLSYEQQSANLTDYKTKSLETLDVEIRQIEMTISQIQIKNDLLTDCYNQLKSQVQGLSRVWTGTAANSAIEMIEEKEKLIKDKTDIAENIIKKLTSIKELYKTTMNRKISNMTLSSLGEINNE